MSFLLLSVALPTLHVIFVFVHVSAFFGKRHIFRSNFDYVKFLVDDACIRP